MKSYNINIGLMMIKETPGGNHSITQPEVVVDICSDMHNMAQESMQILTLNTKNKLIDRHLITLGLMDQSLTHPREIFRPAIIDNAMSIILIHNHPSGDTTPSSDDLRVTRQMLEAGNILGIKILDHIIIGRKPDGSVDYLSMRKSNLASFDYQECGR